MTLQKLSDEQIEQYLARIPDWTRQGNAIKRNLKFPSFLDAIAFINKIAPLAEDADHHPEIFNVYNRVELTLTTHDANGLTDKDFSLAEKIDAKL